MGVNYDNGHSVADDWPPARMAPESYPGACPSGHYLLCNGSVYPLVETTAGSGYDVVHESGKREELDSHLARLGVCPLAERYPVLAYGANRNPGTLNIKFHHYGSSSLASNYCIPVLKATIRGADVAACRLHGHGYFYGELLVDSSFSEQTELEVRVGLVDLGQLRALNDGEGLPQQMYSPARFPGVQVFWSPPGNLTDYVRFQFASLGLARIQYANWILGYCGCRPKVPGHDVARNHGSCS